MVTATGRFRGLRVLGAWCAAVLAAPLLARAGDEDYDRWYVLQMMDQRAGHMHVWQSTAEDGRITSQSVMEMKLARGPVDVEISIETKFIETVDGEPIEMMTRQDLGAMGTTTSRYVWDAEGILQITEQMGRTTEKRHPFPEGEWLTPAEMHRFIAARLAAGAESITYRTLDPAVGPESFGVKHTVVGKTTVEAMGKTVPAVEWKVTQDIMPTVVLNSFVDEKGVDIRSTVPLGGISLTILAADKELALSEFDAPELMASTLVEPDRPIERSSEVRRGSFVLSVRNGDMPELPATSAQRIEKLDEKSVRVVIDIEALQPAPESEVNDPRFLESCDAADTTDPKIIELAEEATKDTPEEPLAQARAIVDFVSRYIDEKSLDVGFASASEVAATRTGDCSEHAILTAALLRARGVPSRTASGLVYVDEFLGEKGVFGYHMWAQALIEVDGKPCWVDLDAAMPMDATHITISVSSLSDEDGFNSLVPLAQVIGQLSIAVEKTE